MYIEWKSKATTFYKRFGFGAFGHRPQKKKEKEKAVANVEDMKKKKKELWACDPCKMMFFFLLS